MIKTPTNEKLNILLKNLKKGKAFSVKSRRILDQNPFAILEVIEFEEIPDKSYILKSMVSILKNEILVHQYASDYKINGAQFIFGHSEPSLHFILMEKIDDIVPIFFIDSEEVKPFFSRITRNLAKFHVESSRDIQMLKNLGVSELGSRYYIGIINKIKYKIKKLSEEMNHPYYLTNDLISEFESKLKKVEKALKTHPKGNLTLIHGDFDFGNFFVKNINEICVLDWGMARIDVPIIDIANLLNSLEDYGLDFQNLILKSYNEVAKPLIPRKFKLSNIRLMGTLMHLLFFLNFQLDLIESFVDPMYYIDQINREVTEILELVKKM
ncbi:MAG: phosphotransferase [Candidatus Heimdallarchaeota archaeon]|nr:MAG: phosphotransferase [Candidatus Heimdallarchaeota archaeon]